MKEPCGKGEYTFNVYLVLIHYYCLKVETWLNINLSPSKEKFRFSFKHNRREMEVKSINSLMSQTNIRKHIG